MGRSLRPSGSRVVVLRLGHRPQRDKRVTTHVALTARAFGADGMVIADVDDPRIVSTVSRVGEFWGGDFFLKSGLPWRPILVEWGERGGSVLHLTMYGIDVDEVIEEIVGLRGDLLVVVGASKTPGGLFDLADYNVSVGSQPHSEVAALAIFLDRLIKRSDVAKRFVGAKMQITPSLHGKRVTNLAGPMVEGTDE